MTTATQQQYETVGFIYKGSFPADFLLADEDFTYTGSGERNCVVLTPRGNVRLRPGDFISRRQDGSLFTTSSDRLDEATGQGRR